ncbi:MAG: CpaF family protein [Bdellovibrionaceae bacterium]|nr:CpaF family protein [Pseudobdellovibrionaceae bacterium]
MDRRDCLRQQFKGESAALLPLLLLPAVQDIVLNGLDSAFVDCGKGLEPVAPPFKSRSGIYALMERMVIPTGRRLEAGRPYLDGCLSDGSRFHLFLPPLAKPGPLVSVRVFAERGELTLEDFGDTEEIDWLLRQISQRRSLLIAGATSSGKTTLLGCLLNRVPPAERLIILEETREIRCQHPHAVFLETRSASAEGVGEVTLPVLVRNALRMRPDRLVVGECRGPEALDLVQALNTGHPGSFCTLHADSARAALRRLETLLWQANGRLPLEVIREWIGHGLGGVVFLRREGHRRRIVERLEVRGAEGTVYRLRPLGPN